MRGPHDAQIGVTERAGTAEEYTAQPAQGGKALVRLLQLFAPPTQSTIRKEGANEYLGDRARDDGQDLGHAHITADPHLLLWLFDPSAVVRRPRGY